MLPASTLRRRVLGLVFFLVLALFLVLTIGSFRGSFTRTLAVTLVTDSVGNALHPGADVKLRGVQVGTVESTGVEHGTVVARLALNPALAQYVLVTATARLMPKTLFGERYVALSADESAAAVTDGAVIHQDVSGNAVEISRVLDGLLPLLQAIPPERLASTLGALAQGFSGRGTEFGLTLDRLHEIFSTVNPELPTVQQTLTGLADFAETYAQAGPQLIDALDNLRVTGNTVVEQRGIFDRLWASLTTGSAATAALLEDNREQLVSFSEDSREALQILARNSPAFSCIFAGFARTAPFAKEVMAADDPYPGIRATITFANPKGRYLPNQDEPRMVDTRPPACYDGYKEPGKPFPQYPGGSGLNDGAYQPPSRNPGSSRPLPGYPAPEGVPDTVPAWKHAAAPVLPASYDRSPAQTANLTAVYAAASGVPAEQIPAWTTAIGAPALRGSEVSIK